MIPSDISSIDPQLQLLDLDRVDFEESLYLFYKGAWPYIDAAPWVDGWAIDAVAEHLQAVCDGEITRLIINISPRCSKSNLVSVAFPAWVWAQNRIGPISGPQTTFVGASYTHQLSLRDSVKCRRLIESPWYQARWGDRFQLTSDQNTKSRFTNDKSGERLTTSIDGTNTGEGGMCFAPGTRVSTPSGPRPIEDIKIGDRIYGFDERRGKVIESFVTATAKRKSNDLCTIHEVSGNRLTCTVDHPIYSPGRGYIRAGEMGKGDRLLVSTNKEQRTRYDASASSMRPLRKGDHASVVLGTKSAQAGEQRFILHPKLFHEASCDQEYEAALPVLRGATPATWQEVLLRRVQGRRQRYEKKENNLPSMRKRIFRYLQSPILLAGVRQRCSLAQNARIEELEVPRNKNSVLQSVQSDAAINQAARRKLLCELRNPGGDGSIVIPPQTLTSGSSHRRRPNEQQAGKSNNDVRKVSQETPHCRSSYIEEIIKYSDDEIEVYDIQVEGCHNFFAEKFLVHNCILIDDPNSVDDVDSEATIQTAIDWWTGTMPTRLNNQETGAYIIIQQRTFENDLTGHILETEAEDWCHLMIPMRYEPDRSFITTIGWKDPRTVEGELMWPERFSEAATKRLERRLGSWRTAGQLQQRPEPAGGGIIKRAWWQLWDSDKFPPLDFVIACLDTASTEETMNDPSGMLVWGVFTETSAQAGRIIAADGNPMYVDRTYTQGVPKIILVHAWDDRLTLHNLVNRVEKTCRTLKVDLLLIENKNIGISVSQEIQRLFRDEKFGVQLFDPKSQDKVARLISIQHLFEEGIIYAPSETYPWVEKVISQVANFPKGKHDEFVDLVSMGLRHLRANGLIARAQERQIEEDEKKIYRGRQEPLYSV